MSLGYVYVLSNPAMPGIVKIGRSIYGGMHRAEALYKGATGMPLPFRVEFEILISDFGLVESLTHKKLAADRVNGGREFFKCDVRDAILSVLQSVAESMDMAYVCPEFVHEADWLDDCARLTGAHPVVVASAISGIPAEAVAPYVVAYEKGIRGVVA